MLIDGARLPAKAAEHARRGNVAQDRATLLKDAAAFDKDGQLDKADDLYRELAYPAPPFVLDWVVAHCRANSIAYVVAPFEADSQGAWMARAGGYLDLVISIDGDFSLGCGCPVVVFVSCGKSDRGKLWPAAPPSASPSASPDRPNLRTRAADTPGSGPMDRDAGRPAKEPARGGEPRRSARRAL